MYRSLMRMIPVLLLPALALALSGLAAALAIAGDLAVSSTALLCRRGTSVRRGDGGEKHP